MTEGVPVNTPVSSSSLPAQPSGYVKQIKQLCSAVGISRDIYVYWNAHPDAPPKNEHKGYDVHAWRQFITLHNITTKESKLASLDGDALDRELKKRNIRLKDLEIAEAEHRLIDRKESDAQLLTLAHQFRQTLEELPSRMYDKFKSSEIKTETERQVSTMLQYLRSQITKLDNMNARKPKTKVNTGSNA